MNEQLAWQHREAIAATLGEPGRWLSHSKAGYSQRYPSHVVVYNANVCLSGGKVWWGDVDLTLEESHLVALAAASNERVYLLDERSGRFKNEEAAALDRAVYSVAPSGETWFDHRAIERRADGTLRQCASSASRA